MKKVTLYILLTILALGTFFRFYQLGVTPPELNWDEAAWGYNAYSIGIDGRDEFGRLLPLDYLESYGDFKPVMYAYLSVLPIKILGLTPFAVRFASAFCGILSIFITYLLVKQIFYSSKQKEWYALLSSFLLAISPWHIMLSRAAFEANVACFFLMAGVLFFLLAVNKRPWFLLLSSFFFVSCIYTFNSSRIVSPLLVVSLSLIFRKRLLMMKKEVVVAIFVAILLLLPTAKFLLSPQAGLRFKEVNIFSDTKLIERSNQEIKNDNDAFYSKVLHNRRFIYGVEFLKHYFDHFNPHFLFIAGDGNPKFSTQDVGQLYLIELPFIIAGILLLIRKREGYWWIIPLWLLIAVIPAGVARETPHALRIENSLPTWQMFAAYGFVNVLRGIKTQELRIKGIVIFSRKTFLATSVILLCLSIFYFQYNYYTHYQREYSGEWQYGYRDMIGFIVQHEKEYNTIYVTEQWGRPYMYYLFYTGLQPSEFRKTASIKRDNFGFVHVERIGKYHFENISQDARDKKEKTLYIDISKKVPKNAKTIKTFSLLNMEPIFTAYEL